MPEDHQPKRFNLVSRPLLWLEAWSLRYIKRSWLFKMALAITLSATAIILRINFNSVLSASPFVVFTFAVFGSTLIGGIYSGLTALMICSLAQLYFFIPPYLALKVPDRISLLAFLTFFLSNLVIVSVTAVLRLSRRLASSNLVAYSRLAGIVQSSDDAIFGKDLNGIITSWNHSAERLFGYSGEEIVGKSVEVLSPKAKKGEYLSLLVRSEPGEAVDHHETQLIAKNGDWIDVEVTISPVRDYMGKVVGASTIARDITERKRIERDQQFLAKASQLFSTTIDYEQTMKNLAQLAVPEIADWCIIDLIIDGKTTRVAVHHLNPKLVKLSWQMHRSYPYKDDYPHGVPLVIRTGEPDLMSIITPQMWDVEELNPKHRQTLKAMNIISSMVVPLKASGKVIGTLSFQASDSGRHFGKPELDLAQKLADMAAGAIENAELYRQALSSQKQLQAIFENVADGLTVVDASGHMLFANDAAAKMSGYDTWRDFVANYSNRVMGKMTVRDEQGRRLTVDQLPSRLAIATKQMQQQLLVYDFNGEDHWNLVKSTPILNIEGKVDLVVTTMNDFTERRRLEQRKDEFIAIASHELKTPLTSMKTYAQSMLRAAGRRGASEDELHGLEVISRQTDRLSELVGNILDVSKINSGEIVMSLQPVDINNLVGTVTERLGIIVGSERLRKRLIGEMVVLADPSRVEQVLVNLMNNAIAYSPVDSPVTVTVERSGDEAIVSVSDHGPGLKLDDQDKVFERFTRGSNNQITGTGMGLGLYIAKQIIDQHHGRIWVESQLGYGSKFSFALPLDKSRLKPQPTAKLLKRS